MKSGFLQPNKLPLYTTRSGRVSLPLNLDVDFPSLDSSKRKPPSTSKTKSKRNAKSSSSSRNFPLPGSVQAIFGSCRLDDASGPSKPGTSSCSPVNIKSLFVEENDSADAVIPCAASTMCIGNVPLEVPIKFVGDNNALLCAAPPMDLNESPAALQASSHDNVNTAKPFGQDTQHKTCPGCLLPETQHKTSPHSASLPEAHNWVSLFSRKPSNAGSWIEEINQRKADVLANEVLVEGLKQRERKLAAQNEMLKIDKVNLRKRIADLDDKLKAIVGSQNMNGHGESSLKFKDGMCTRVGNEDHLSRRLAQSDKLLSHVRTSMKKST